MNESDNPEQHHEPELPARSGGGWAWPAAFAVVALALIVTGGLLARSCMEQPAKMADSVSRALQPQVTVSTVIQTSLDKLRDESKLVVYTANVSVMVTKTSEKKIFYGKLDLGRTTVRLRSSGNKAQIIVPLKSLRAGDFVFDEARNQLTVTIPPPRVDENLVEVQTDPAYFEVETDVGWGRLGNFSGDFLKGEARRDLRPAVIAEAGSPRNIELAKQNAREKISAILEPVVRQLRNGATVDIQFKN